MTFPLPDIKAPGLDKARAALAGERVTTARIKSLLALAHDAWVARD